MLGPNAKLAFKLLLILCIFVCLLHEVDAKAKKQKGNKNGKGAVKSNSNGSTQMLTKKHSRHSLTQFLNKKPKNLWKTKKITKAHRLRYKRLVGHKAPTQRDMQMVTKARAKAKTTAGRKHKKVEDLPKEFDARQKWSNCASIKEIQDQSTCGSCWAVASASAMSDRACIQTNGNRQPKISSTDLLTCCEDCKGGSDDGCQGGISFRAWIHYETKGLVNGGKYGSNEGCKPYVFPPANSPGVENEVKSPKCTSQCANSQSYESSKHYGTNTVYPEGMEEMMNEIYTNGPIATAMDVFTDFYEYKSGIYNHRDGQKVGGHLVRVVGWGEENDVPYWLVANSWGEEFGEKGLFRIVRGTNHVNFEKYAVAGSYDESRSASS